MKKGISIIFEGTDGGGKKTQQDFLVKKLQEVGFEIATFDFPQYGGRSCAMVEDYLNGKFGGINDVGAKAASIFYAVDRFAAKIPMLEAIDLGKILIFNRYVTSNQGYQGAKIKDPEERKRFFVWLDELEYEIFGIPRPNLCIFLDVPPEIGQQLVDKKGSRDYVGGEKRDMHEADKEFLESSYRVYKELAGEPGWIIINCVENGQILSPEKISELVFEQVMRYIESN